MLILDNKSLFLDEDGGGRGWISNRIKMIFLMCNNPKTVAQSLEVEKIIAVRGYNESKKEG